MTVETRRCSRCRVVKPVDQFRLDAKGRVRSHCIPCGNAVNQDWRAANRDRLLAERRARYAELRNAGLTPVEASAHR